MAKTCPELAESIAEIELLSIWILWHWLAILAIYVH